MDHPDSDPQPSDGDGQGDRPPAEALIEALNAAGGELTLIELCERTGLPNRQARDTLARLARAGLVTRISRGVYRDANDDNAAPVATPERRPYGSVRSGARQLLADDPAREWTARQFAEALGIGHKHAMVVLAELARAGDAVRVAPGRFTGGSSGPAGQQPPTEVEVLGQVNGAIVLMRDELGRLWSARPARLSSP